MPEVDVIPTSASVASVGPSIRYIGKHCYALSGQISAHTDTQIALDFTSSGGGYIMAEIEFTGFVNPTDPSQGTTGCSTIKFNNIAVANSKVITGNGSTASTPTNDIIKILIPPLTHVLITVDASGVSASKYATIILIGEVFGAE